MPEAGGDYRLGTEKPVVILELSVTTWCNYRCAYCPTPVDAHRAAARHAFDFHRVEDWTAAFERVPFEFSLLFRGGEPFLDHESFARLLTGVGALPTLRYARADTNGSWAPDRYESVPRDVRAKIQLNVSFHPTQIGLEPFKKRLARIVEAGWQVGMINYVMEAGQAAGYAEVRDFFERQHGIFVNPNPDVLDPVWTSPLPSVQREARGRLQSLLPRVDMLAKTAAPTAGRACRFPSIAYFIGPEGMAERACGVRVAGEARRLDFIRDSASLRPLPIPVTCPQACCVCLDRYAFLEDVPERGRAIDLLGEYVRACRAHQQAR